MNFTTTVTSTVTINIQEIAYFTMRCVKYLKSLFCTAGEQTAVFLFLHRAGSISLKGDLKKENAFSQFSGPRRQIKVVASACCHGDDSGAFSLFLIPLGEM